MDDKTFKRFLRLYRQGRHLRKLKEPFEEEPDPSGGPIARALKKELARRAGWKYRFGQWIRRTCKKGSSGT